MAYNYAKLRGRIVEMYGNQTSFAKVLGISQQSVSKCLRSENGFSRKSMEKWAEALDIPQKDYLQYFFA